MHRNKTDLERKEKKSLKLKEKQIISHPTKYSQSKKKKISFFSFFEETPKY